MTDRAALTRRGLLSLAGVTGVGLVVAACSRDGGAGTGSGSGAGSGSATDSPAADPVARSLTPARVPLAGGVTITVTGTALAGVRGVTVGGIPARDVVATATSVRFTAPHQAMYTAGAAPVALYGQALEPVASANVTTADGNGSTSNDGVGGDAATSGPTSAPSASAPTGPALATTTLTYAALTDVDRQLQYAMVHWSNYNLAEYGNMNDIGGDCANFVSQTLIARGLQQRSDWYSRDAGAEHSATWTYCPSLDPWLDDNASTFGLTRRPLSDRAKVRVGDIVMWDWNGNGSPDHTTIVSEVFPQSDGTVLIKSVSHNEDGPYRDLDDMITVQHPGGTAWFHTFAS